MIAAAVLFAAAASGPLGCGAVTRPGVAVLGEDGVWRGRAVELCRAAAEQVGGPGTPIAFHSYDSATDLRAAPDDDIAFVSAAELATVPGLRAGPTIAVERQVLAVKRGSPVRTIGDLAGRLICFIVGTRAEDALNVSASRTGVPVERLAFQEPVEMQDAFDVGKCAAEAVDAAELEGAANTRMLDPPLDTTPIVAATPMKAGDPWRKAVGAVVAADKESAKPR